MKDLLTDLMNEYGHDLENLPEDFDMDAYLKERASEKSRTEQNI